MHRHPSILALAAALAAPTGAALAGGGPPSGTITNIQASLNGGWSLQSASYLGQSHYDLHTLAVQETALPPEPWSDLVFTVTRVVGESNPAMIAIDKNVLNATGRHWTDFHMEIGLYVRANDLAPIDGLDFKADPLPSEETGRFKNPPMFGISGPLGVPSLWWFADSPGTPPPYPGVAPSDSAQFWLGINVPSSLFSTLDRGTTPGIEETATFILRQHWTPTPGALAAFAIAGVIGARRRGRSTNRTPVKTPFMIRRGASPSTGTTEEHHA